MPLQISQRRSAQPASIKTGLREHEAGGFRRLPQSKTEWYARSLGQHDKSEWAGSAEPSRTTQGWPEYRTGAVGPGEVRRAQRGTLCLYRRLGESRPPAARVLQDGVACMRMAASSAADPGRKARQRAGRRFRGRSSKKRRHHGGGFDGGFTALGVHGAGFRSSSVTKQFRTRCLIASPTTPPAGLPPPAVYVHPKWPSVACECSPP